MSTKPVASLSLDLDNKWAYLKTHGDSGWDSFPSYFDKVVPRFLGVMKNLGLNMTVFVVGQDAALKKNGDALKAIAEADHEIANHSFHHEPWLHLYTPSQLTEEFQRSEEAIFEVTGRRTRGFRGPGFSLTDQVLKTLIDRDYDYDCSTFPTFLGPVARAYYFMKSGLSKQDREDRKALFGRLSDGFQSLKPFYWNGSEGRKILEIPVSTIPVVKTPFHSSYLLYLATFSVAAARSYFWMALRMCRLFGVEPSFLLHPLDFLGADDEPELAFFPGMKLPGAKKVELMTEFLEGFGRQFQILDMSAHAKRICQSPAAPNRPLQLARAGLS